MRYSDDILLVLPGSSEVADEAKDLADDEIRNYGPELQINESKTCAVRFYRDGTDLSYSHICGRQGKNGFEYLGFRFDGKKVYVRDSTLSRLYRKVSESAKGVARGFVYSHNDKNVSEILSAFNYSKFTQRFSRVHPDGLSPEDYGTWTFYSYLKRASEIFGPRGDRIMSQASNCKRIMKDRVDKAMRAAVIRRDRALAKQRP